jgi:hypothetical protein
MPDWPPSAAQVLPGRFAHHGGRPFRLIGEFHLGRVDARNAPGSSLHRFLEERRRRAAARSCGHLHVSYVILDLYGVDQPEIDDILAQFGIDHPGERLFHAGCQRLLLDRHFCSPS